MPRRRQLLNLPNALTLSRFAFAPVMLHLVLSFSDPAADVHAWRVSAAALPVLVLAMLTDLFDGMVARARGEVTNFGRIMDPVADSTLFMTLLFALAASGRFAGSVSVWMPILVLYREVAMHILRRYAALKGNAVPAKLSGKVKTFTQSLFMIAFFAAVAARDWTFANASDGAALSEGFLRRLAFAVGAYSVLASILSMIEYCREVPELVAEYHTEPAGPEPPPEGADR